MIKPVLKLYKKVGETPLECLERFRLENPEYAGLPMTYAGRLDPLASGELLVLTGEECKNREKYLGLNKVYRVKVLFRVATDTHDVLGIVRKSNFDLSTSVFASEAWQSRNLNVVLKPNSESWIATSKTPRKDGGDQDDVIKILLKKYIRKFTQDYPDYSSKTVNGEALFSLARKGLLGDIEKPTKEVEIFKINILGYENKKAEELLIEIQGKVNLVKGDFRQTEILERWNEFFENNKEKIFKILEIEVNCSSGTYMRSLADRLGKDLGCGAVAWEIERIKSY
ncbi:MAG: hypothetical protein WCO30_01155 [bacterium]